MTPDEIYRRTFDFILQRYRNADGRDVIDGLLHCVAAIVAGQPGETARQCLAMEVNADLRRLLAHAAVNPMVPDEPVYGASSAQPRSKAH